MVMSYLITTNVHYEICFYLDRLALLINMTKIFSQVGRVFSVLFVIKVRPAALNFFVLVASFPLKI